MKVGKHNALSGNTAYGGTDPAYDGEYLLQYYTPTLRLAMWHAFADTRGLRHPSVRPNHLASPSRLRAPWDVGRASALGRKFRDPKPIS
jgi:hypothetical protein